MTMPLPELTPTEKAHAWQNHRIQCLKLAIKAASGRNAVDLAKQFSDYIMTRQAQELAVKNDSD